MSDVTIKRRSNTAVILGNTPAGEKYVGSIFVRGMEVFDKGYVTIPAKFADNVNAEATRLGLSVSKEENNGR